MNWNLFFVTPAGSILGSMSSLLIYFDSEQPHDQKKTVWFAYKENLLNEQPPFVQLEVVTEITIHTGGAACLV